MKRFNTPFIIALAISVMALAAAYADGESHPASPSNYVWYDHLQELNELCRTKYRRSRCYEQCARHAEDEHRHDVAALFMAMSRAEAIHCDNCRRAIASLGGRFRAPVAEAPPRRTAREHLRRALREMDSVRSRRSENRTCGEMYRDNRNIARMLTWCDASDIHQIMILRRMLGSMDSAVRTAPHHTSPRSEDRAGSAAGCRARTVLYAVCPTCGDVTESGLHADRCPHCMTDCRRFILY